MNLLQYIVQMYCKIREIKGPGAEYTLPDPYIVLAGAQSSFKEIRESEYTVFAPSRDNSHDNESHPLRN